MTKVILVTRMLLLCANYSERLVLLQIGKLWLLVNRRNTKIIINLHFKRIEGRVASMLTTHMPKYVRLFKPWVRTDVTVIEAKNLIAKDSSGFRCALMIHCDSQLVAIHTYY